MRIAQIMLGKGFGGAERSFVDLCRALSQRGHEVLAICETRADARDELAAIEDIADATVTVRGPWDPLARWQLQRLLGEFRPAIAQMHLARAASLGGAAARSLAIPTLAKTHNYVKPKYYRAIDHLVATTRKQFDYLRAQGIPDAELSIIPNFSAITPRQHAPPADDGPLRAVAIGRMVRKKGFDVLFDALARARALGLTVHLALAGDGPESDALHDQLDALGLRESVTFLGWQHNVAACLATADVFVLPSREEPFGIVCLEAMACGIPIIATATDGPVTFLDDTTAIVVPPADAGALAQGLYAVARDRAGATARATAARSRFEALYSEPVVVGQYLDLYARLIGTSNEIVAR
ncbi:MAG: glycosyltransferase [Gammaproteobacteria bacterium]|jgi:glycosyltransferase involved in cell wall biosynthesis